MELEPIIAALRTRCPIFGGRVAGAAQFNLLPENAALEVPCAFVIPLDDDPQENISMNGVSQVLKDSFAVVIAVNNKLDERGQSSVSNVHAIRLLLWKSLLGWEPAEEYDGIVYEGGQVMRLDMRGFGISLSLAPICRFKSQTAGCAPTTIKTTHWLSCPTSTVRIFAPTTSTRATAMCTLHHSQTAALRLTLA